DAEKYDSLKKFKSLVSKISDDITLFENVTEASKFTNKDSMMYPISDFLKILEGRTVYAPLIMKMVRIHEKALITKNIKAINKLREYLRAVETFEVRFQVVSYRGQSLSEKFTSVTRQLDDLTTPSELFEMMTNNEGSLSISTIDAFERSLNNASLQNKVASIMSLRIENFLRFGGFEYSKDDEFVGYYQRVSREHIMPVKYGKHWLDDLRQWVEESAHEILDEEIKRTSNLIGNSIIAPDWKNSEWGNLSFSEKWKKYTKNNVIPSLYLFQGFEYNDIVLKPIEEHTKFTPNLIDERTQEIAKLAKIIWKDM
ncbi:HNH endonuclease family protein, partial [Mycoplasma marinum]